MQEAQALVSSASSTNEGAQPQTSPEKNGPQVDTTDIYVYIYLSIYLYIYLSIYLSIYISIDLSI